MKIFITRVWGFDPAKWPVITFGLEGNRDNLIRDSSPGDLIVFVGTLKKPTPEERRGRILGLAEIGRRAVETLDVIDPGIRNPGDFDANGNFKWPKAILMVRAWRFDPQPMLLDVLTEQLPYHATSQAVLLSPEDTTAILALTASEVELPVTDALQKARLLDQALSQGKPTTGPMPTSWSGSTGRSVDRHAFTYAFRFGTSEVWKIGHTVDVGERLKQVNQHVPMEVVGQQWRAVIQHTWNSEVDAHGMEQRVFQALLPYRTSGERVKCKEQVLMSAWILAIGA
jgi:hypothetical protein